MSKNKEKTAAEEVKEEQTAPAGENTEETKAEETAEAPKAAETQAEEKPAEEKKPEKDPAAELAAMNDKYLRLMAEYDNFRKRSQKEKDALYGDIKANALKAFLPVYDNLVRALQQPTEDEAVQHHHGEAGRDADGLPGAEIRPRLPQRGHARGGRGKGRKRDRGGLPAGLYAGGQGGPLRHGKSSKLRLIRRKPLSI